VATPATAATPAGAATAAAATVDGDVTAGANLAAAFDVGGATYQYSPVCAREPEAVMTPTPTTALGAAAAFGGGSIARRKSERRAHTRHHLGRRMTCLLAPEGEGPPLRGEIQNLSARGVAVVARKWFGAGEVVTVRLFNETVTFSIEAKLRVTRAFTLAGGEYAIAGELDRVLGPAELLPFLR
jgi:hypothetical protein